MYRFIKKIYLALIPSKLRHQLNPITRKILYKLFYSGKNNYCPSCNSYLRKFISYNHENFNELICPKCGSLSRTRTLTLYLEETISKEKINILDFSPHRSIYDYWISKKVNYVANDFENEFLSNSQEDITNLTFDSEHFDLIICYHILEHIPDDSKAIQELYRVLKKQSTLLAQVPFKKGKTDEDLTITDPVKRKERFGQEDHVRYYGKDDFIEKLSLAGFKVNTLQYSKTLNDQMIKLYGLKKEDTIFICIK